jgi:hypothetical protein
MSKKTWMVAAIVALGLMSGLAQANSAPVPTPVPTPRGCSHAGGACTWSGDCCMNENLSCKTDSNGKGTCTAQ